MRKLFFMNKEYKELLRDQEIVFLIIAQIVSALKHLYDNKYCHRDLKLDNILINSETFQIKLIDFNTAKYITETDLSCTIIDSGPTSNYNILDKNCGRKEKFKKTDEIFYKDIYSLGVIIYSLVTQQLVDENFNYIFALYSNNVHRHFEKHLSNQGFHY
jgi:serine/threonine protein kinase